MFAQTSKEKTEYSDSRAVNPMCESEQLEQVIQQYKDAGLYEFLDEICHILLAREKYRRVKHFLMHSRTRWFREHRERRWPPPVPVSEDMKKLLGEIRAYLQKAIEGFGIKKNGVVKIPEKLIGQLIQADGLLSVIERGGNIEGSGYGYDVDMVDQRMGLALKYSLIWAREGFK